MFVLSKIVTVYFNWRTLSIVDLDGDLCLESWVFTTFYKYFSLFDNLLTAKWWKYAENGTIVYIQLQVLLQVREAGTWGVSSEILNITSFWYKSAPVL